MSKIEIAIQGGEKYEGELTTDNMVIIPLSVFERMAHVQMAQKLEISQLSEKLHEIKGKP